MADSVHSIEHIRQLVDELYQTESRRVFATLIRLLGDFDLAEEALHDAFAAAVEQWSKTGVPEKPRAWLVSTGRFKAIDSIRSRARFDASLDEIARTLDRSNEKTEPEQELADDQLRLIFTCCHPALPESTQVALTMREVCGLTTEEIASAFLTTPVTIAQRIVRGKAKIRDAKIPYEVPSLANIPERLESVLTVIYLVFNEGYSASSGQSVTRAELSNEAIRLSRLLVELLPDSEAMGLLALMLLHESRRKARTSPNGDLILLEEQDRSTWNRTLIQEGQALVQRALGTREFGSYTIQAAISAVHSDAASTDKTDWPQIVALYDLLLRAQPSPVVRLNRAVAIAMRDGPAAGLQLIDEILSKGDLADYHLAHAARADLFRRLGRKTEAKAAYQRVLTLVKQEPERRFIEKRMAELD